jgi:hypothetical protein
MELTDDQRSQMRLGTQSRAVRVAIYDVGILIGLLFAAEKAPQIWPQYSGVVLASAVGMWVSLVFARYKDWRTIEDLEGRLTEDSIKKILDDN